jgi:hypothetical protein
LRESYPPRSLDGPKLVILKLWRTEWCSSLPQSVALSETKRWDPEV